MSHDDLSSEALAETLSLKMELFDDGVTWMYTNHLGEYHRVHGPAVIGPEGSERWYRHDKLHREGGPAITFPGSRVEWRVNGVCHRVDGPAIIYLHGSGSLWQVEWWLNGRKVTKLKHQRLAARGLT